MRRGSGCGGGDGRISEHVGVGYGSLAGVTIGVARLLVPERDVVAASARPEAQHDLRQRRGLADKDQSSSRGQGRAGERQTEGKGRGKKGRAGKRRGARDRGESMEVTTGKGKERKARESRGVRDLR